MGDCFSLWAQFDFDLNYTLSIDELTILIMSCIRGMCRLARIPLRLSADFIRDIEAIAKDAFVQMDKHHDHAITKEVRNEWHMCCRCRRDIQEFWFIHLVFMFEIRFVRRSSYLGRVRIARIWIT